MWIAGILSILVALVFPMEQYENFLFFIGAMFMPLFGVVLSDYFIVRQRLLDIDALYQADGHYWYFKGFNIIALLSWGVGFVVYEVIAIMKYTIGGSLPSMLVAGICYLLLTRWKKNT
jgi:NCS1 family nucleobase:cation symporter-1